MPILFEVVDKSRVRRQSLRYSPSSLRLRKTNGGGTRSDRAFTRDPLWIKKQGKILIRQMKRQKKFSVAERSYGAHEEALSRLQGSE